MKLILVNRYFFPDQSATSRMVSSLAFALADRGWGVEIVTSRQRYDDPDAALPETEVVRGVTVHRIWTTRFGRSRLTGRTSDYLSFYASAFQRIRRLAGRDDVIVACTDPPLLSIVAWAAATLSHAKLANWLQDLFPEVASALGIRGATWTASLLRQIRNASLRAARANIVLGDRMGRYLRDEGVGPHRITIIHNWSDKTAIRPIPPLRNELRRQWDLDGRFVVGYSGNMGRAHEFETILAAAERLRHMPEILFLFTGGGHWKPWIEQEAGRRGLTNIVLKPLQPEDLLCESLCIPDVHLISLRPELEGFIVPSKIYGILAAGRPTLFIGDVEGEIATLIAHADCGATVPVGEGDRLAERIIELHRSKSLCRRWSVNARRVFVGRFDRNLAVAAWDRLLAELAGPDLRPVPNSAAVARASVGDPLFGEPALRSRSDRATHGLSS